MDLNLSVFASPRHPGISAVKKIKDVGWLSIDADDAKGEISSAKSRCISDVCHRARGPASCTPYPGATKG
jgi:hypothetical protein